MLMASARRWIFPAGKDRLIDGGDEIGRHYVADEARTVKFLLEQARLPRARAETVQRDARKLVEAIRKRHHAAAGLDAFLSEYDLSSAEGIVLMCLAEALLRIPDAETADKLISEKLGDADWQAHIGASESLFVNASTWALMLTGRLVRPDEVPRQSLPSFLARLMDRVGDPVVRSALRQAMRILGHEFVMGRTIEQALHRAAEQPDYCYSFDMLGEAALTRDDAERYFAAYLRAIEALRETGGNADITTAPSISVKLSALSPRFEYAQSARAVPELAARLEILAAAAAEGGFALTVDAEEADRLEPTLAVFEKVFKMPSLAHYSGLGIAVQAYQKRAWHVLLWLEELAASERRVIPVRLVKGAYWDTEIKRAQQQGLAGYPVFTRKTSTDVSYLACAKLLLLASPHLYPQFATHNAHTVCWVLNVGARSRFEFQRLHGMGEQLYGELMTSPSFDRPVRVYAPVGSHKDLLPYLVRRLLENGANTSFVHRLTRADVPIEQLAADPVAATEAHLNALPHPRIPLPVDLFGEERSNSRGWNLADGVELRRLAADLERSSGPWQAGPIVGGKRMPGAELEQRDPADRRRVIGRVAVATKAGAAEAVGAAAAFHREWNETPVRARTAILRRAAELFEQDGPELIARCVAEAGKTVADAVAEVREAADYLRYYSSEAEKLFAAPVKLPGPTGEHNELRLNGRGVFVCISPWNFPLAIFTGQIAGALAAGNTVIAKPAEQTPLVAARAVELLAQAGLPWPALQFLPGPGPELGEALLSDARVAGVAFTGSVETGRAIARTLAGRDGPLAALIAETGGVNAMIVDSSALPEQVVIDVVQSAFNSTGQRCSALRLLCLQEDIADRVIEMLVGHMAELVVGDPALISTDVGPVIDEEAHAALSSYVESRRSRIVYQTPFDPSESRGLFLAPTLIRLDAARELAQEVFGPVLHVVRYEESQLEALIDDINSTGYGLTLGVHSRIDRVARQIARHARVGNVYVNRNIIGAQVGVQPFGGVNLSGTGPKAGGPHYLLQFASEQTYTVNTMAVGGNATLLSLDAEER
ncbi:MAG TPA: bifunctional proline dehydrogenase/L-glutamate gamma-semialdehyde dehydrogenase PutA [Gammaproteobacteria bacterium]|nr:bifunctional proline dehydrogenase/L-glutamate gamma-semialdehyde dehydrogenase PutA [Gammaproteobacteria bacterium]